MFSCVWLHFKKIFGKYFLMFGCILENTIENIFFTCCSHFLTFSQLPNKHIMSFIPKNSNKTQKDSIFSRWDRDRDRRRSAQFRWPARSRSWCVGWVVLAQWRLDSVVKAWQSRACERGEETIWSENNDWNQFQSFLADFSVKLHNQTHDFPEIDFRKSISVKTNGAKSQRKIQISVNTGKIKSSVEK